MRAILLGTGGLVAALLVPLLLIASLLGSIGFDTSATPSVSGAGLAAPAAFSGSTGGCTQPDPTGGRCLTPATRHLHDEIVRAFGEVGRDGAIRSAGCWDAHAWNPRSDHPRGRACDYFPTATGTFATGTDLQNGWRLANWLRSHAVELRVGYVIWQGRIWSPGDPDVGGWGRRYNGGGVYDPNDATGGHFDHVHVSVSA